jgi:hypothetical protein
MERLALESRYNEKGKLIFGINEKKTKKDNKLLKLLSKRYELCDSEGHKHPNESTNRCEFCYRTLKDNLPRISRTFSLNKLPMFNAANHKKDKIYFEGPRIARDMIIGLNLLEKELISNNNS